MNTNDLKKLINKKKNSEVSSEEFREYLLNSFGIMLEEEGPIEVVKTKKDSHDNAKKSF